MKTIITAHPVETTIEGINFGDLFRIGKSYYMRLEFTSELPGAKIIVPSTHLPAVNVKTGKLRMVHIHHKVCRVEGELYLYGGFDGD